MTVTNQQRRAIARLKRGPCLAFDIGEAVHGAPAVDGADAREALGKRGARIAGRLAALGLVRFNTRAGLTVYGLTRKGNEVTT